MPRVARVHDEALEIATLQDELEDAYRRLTECDKEAIPEICRQIAEIKRDIQRNSAILEARMKKVLRNQTQINKTRQDCTSGSPKTAEYQL